MTERPPEAKEPEEVEISGPGLALDCAGAVAWAGLQLGPQVVEVAFDPRGVSAAEQISALLRSQNLSVEDLRHLAVGVGPGPYTSTRSGVAAMQGLACATGLPLRAVRSDRAAAAQLGMDSGVPRALVATLPAKGQDWHFWLYDAGSDDIAAPAEWDPVAHRRISKFCIDTQNSPQDVETLGAETGADWVVAEPGGLMRALFALAGQVRPLPPELVQPHYAGVAPYRRHNEEAAGAGKANDAKGMEGAADAAG